MRHRTWTLLAAVLAVAQLSCATANMTPLSESMPAARASLLPEYRIFYDALQDYGDWVLIEPYGYVFRPVDNVVGWRPYQDGYWAPSDVYGWVWISAEPFGWATYHYGNWFYDRYQGWVWAPGLDWAPAWVSWQQTPSYVGWAPLFPSGSSSSVPGGPYVYVPAGQLAATDLKTHVLTAQQVGPALGTPEPVRNVVERDGVRINLGPSISEVERRTGPLQRVKIEDTAEPGARGGGRAEAPADRTRELEKPQTRPAPATAPGASAAVESMRRAAEESARQAKAVGEKKAAPPANVYLPRPVGKRGEKPAEGRAREGFRDRTAPADTTHH